jgi:hypothetical protein
MHKKKSLISFFQIPLALLCSLAITQLYAQEQPFVEFDEIAPELTQNIENHLSIASEDCAISPRRLRTITDTFDEKIDQAVRAYGYYNATWKYQVEDTENC